MKVKDFAHGQWPKIIGQLVGEQYTNPRKHLACPGTGDAGKGTPRFRFADKFGNGNFFCHCSDGEKDGFDLLMCVNGYDFKSAKRDVESLIGECPKDDSYVAQGKTFAEQMRTKAVSTKTSAYLASRGLEVAPGLEWIKEIPYHDEDGKSIGLYAAMAAPIMRDGKFLTYHITYLSNGSKADVPIVRKILSGPANSGASCPLYEAAEAMGVAEGVETAIAAKMIFCLPVWAALNTALMAAWEPPAIAKRVTIFGDNDANYAGHAAAYQLAHRLVKKGLEVEIQIPPTVGHDWNNVLMDNRSLVE